jgi:hypothetical protein
MNTTEKINRIVELIINFDETRKSKDTICNLAHEVCTAKFQSDWNLCALYFESKLTIEILEDEGYEENTPMEVAGFIVECKEIFNENTILA